MEGDLSDPEALAAIGRGLRRVENLDTDVLARGSDGTIEVQPGVFDVFDQTWESPVMVDLVAQQTGIVLTDTNGDGIPDTRAQVEALLAVGGTVGVPFDRTHLSVTPDDVNTAIRLLDPSSRSASDGDGGSETPAAEQAGGSVAGPWAAVFTMQVVNSRTQEAVSEARAVLDPIAADLGDDLGGTFVQLTGSPFEREASLDATNRALQVSLPVALVMCLVIGSVFLRSVRYGLAAVAPTVLVVTWLYGLMFFAGFAINLVTATIAAISVGIGIDFAIHFVVRYRQELATLGPAASCVDCEDVRLQPKSLAGSGHLH